jgi:integrase
LSESEVSKLLNYLRKDKQLYILTILALYTGARISSLCKITKKDINFDAGQINIIDVKNNSHYTSYVTNQTIKGELEIYTKDLRDSDFLFHNKQDTLQKKLQKILNSLFNANVVDSLDRVVVHTLRHTFASHLAMSGTSPLMIKKLMNHSSLKMTERYVKLSESNLSDAVNKLTFLAK